jgi:hypothetical protein
MDIRESTRKHQKSKCPTAAEPREDTVRQAAAMSARRRTR